MLKVRNDKKWEIQSEIFIYVRRNVIFSLKYCRCLFFIKFQFIVQFMDMIFDKNILLSSLIW